MNNQLGMPSSNAESVKQNIITYLNGKLPRVISVLLVTLLATVWYGSARCLIINKLSHTGYIRMLRFLVFKWWVCFSCSHFSQYICPLVIVIPRRMVCSLMSGYQKSVPFTLLHVSIQNSAANQDMDIKLGTELVLGHITYWHVQSQLKVIGSQNVEISYGIWGLHYGWLQF